MDLRLIFGEASYYRVIVREDRGPVVGVNAGTLEHFLNVHIEPGLNIPFVTEKIGDGRFLSEREVHAVEVTGPRARQGQSCLPQRLAWRGTGVDTGATEFVVGIDERHALPESTASSRPDYSRRAATDHNQVIVPLVHPDHLY